MKASNDNAIYLYNSALGLGKDYYQKENEANTKPLQNIPNMFSKHVDSFGYQNPNETAG